MSARHATVRAIAGEYFLVRRGEHQRHVRRRGSPRPADAAQPPVGGPRPPRARLGRAPHRAGPPDQDLAVATRDLALAPRRGRHARGRGRHHADGHGRRGARPRASLRSRTRGESTSSVAARRARSSCRTRTRRASMCRSCDAAGPCSCKTWGARTARRSREAWVATGSRRRLAATGDAARRALRPRRDEPVADALAELEALRRRGAPRRRRSPTPAPPCPASRDTSHAGRCRASGRCAAAASPYDPPRASRRATRSGWSATDVAVAGAAILVIALSAAGLLLAAQDLIRGRATGSARYSLPGRDDGTAR